jgi:hypothetical protein
MHLTKSRLINWTRSAGGLRPASRSKNCRWSEEPFTLAAGGGLRELPPKRAMRCPPLQGRVNDALDLVPGCLYFRSVLLILSRLRLREYVASIADKQGYGTICRMQRSTGRFDHPACFASPNLPRGSPLLSPARQGRGEPRMSRLIRLPRG